MDRIEAIRKRLEDQPTVVSNDYETALQNRLSSLKKPIEPTSNTTQEKILSVAIPLAGIVEAIASKGQGKASQTLMGTMKAEKAAKKSEFEKKTGEYNTESDLLNKTLFDVRNKIAADRIAGKKDIMDTERLLADIQKNEWEMAKPSADQIEINKEDRKALREAKTLSDKTAAADKIITTLDIKDPLKREAVRQLLIKGEGLGDIYKAELEARTKALEAVKKGDGTNVSNPIRALDIANAGLDDIAKIRSNPAKDSYFSPLMGTLRGLNPLTGGKPFSGTESANLEANIDALRSKLTTANLDLMKGVLSNTDIQILRKAATSLSQNTTQEQFLNELDRVENVFLRNKANLEKIVPVEQRVVPSETAPGVTKKNREWDPKLQRIK